MGSSKSEPNAPKPPPTHTDGSLQYISHRQDQAVLTLLVYDRMRTSRTFNAQLVYPGISPYLCVGTQRFRGNVKSLADWNRTQGIPRLRDPLVCEQVAGVNWAAA